jgi:phenylalanyl-tRNA synthetase alpha chain
MPEELSPAERRVLKAVGEAGGEATPEEVQQAQDFEQEVQVMSGANWLQSKGLLEITEHTTIHVTLGPEGREVLEDELPERRALRYLLEAGVTSPGALVGEGVLEGHEVPIAIGWLKQKGLADVDESGEETILRPHEDAADGLDGTWPDEQVLQALAAADGPVHADDLDGEGLEILRGRGDMIEETESVTRVLALSTKGQQRVADGVELSESVSQITPDLIQSGEWQDKEIRPYDVTDYAPAATGGKRHPLQGIIDRIRDIFLSMGFTEMSGPFVRSAFWNMDALFTPQDHPAREMHDTFYLEEPDRVDLEDDDLVDRVRAVHEDGGETGSRGWGTDWSRDEAERSLLRTHTTVDSVEYLHENPDEPCKVFSVDRVFRKEELDRTHLPEFHQVEGIVMEPDAHFGQLVGLLTTFYEKLGFPDVRVRPAYFPYTEPSLEVEVVHGGEWMELGGAGIFRPEVTRPLGVEWPVLAWGLGLERLAMMILDLDDIRDLYISDVEWLREAPLQG